jgi:hypothetical protein
MIDRNSHSMVLAADYRVSDVDHMLSLIEEHLPHLVSIGAHHVVVYRSIWEPGRILVTIGIRYRESVEQILASAAMFELFDDAGVTDIPAVFVGEIVEKFDLRGSDGSNSQPGIVVGAFAPINDITVLIEKVGSGLDRFARAGCRQLWVYRALDTEREVMILQDVENEAVARRWTSRPDAAAEWISAAGFGAYPTVFVGTLASSMPIGRTG